MKLSEKLIYLRKEKRLSQLKLAELMNVSRQAVSRWEVGAATPSIENLKYLSGLYGVSLEYLLDDGEDGPGERALAPAGTGGRGLGKKAVLKLTAAAVCIFALGAGAAFGFMGLAKRDSGGDAGGGISQYVHDGCTVTVGGTDAPAYGDYVEVEPEGAIGGRLSGYGIVDYDGGLVGMVTYPALEK